MDDTMFNDDSDQDQPEVKAKTYKFTIVCESLSEISHLKAVFSTNGRRVVYSDAINTIVQSIADSPDLTDEKPVGFGSSL